MHPLSETASAKINLTLKVLGRRPDGYHELDSLVAFAGPPAADRLSLEPGGQLTLEIVGSGASALSSEDVGSNLVVRAAEAARRICPDLRLGAFRLEKNLPVAAGIGGGSSDSAAALRLIRRLNPDHESAIDWHAVAASIGADVPVCLLGRFARMTGLGEHLAPLSPLPPVWAVLANPRVPLSTAPVFKALGAAPLRARPETSPPPQFHELDDLIDYLGARSNDLEAAAIPICPEVGRVRARLGSLDGMLLSRMSGSGPTCFALFATHAAAEAGARELRAVEPGWWTEAARLQ